MNRQQRRLLQSQGESTEATEDGVPAPQEVEPADRERRTTRPLPGVAHRRTSPRQFLHEVNVELRKVAWPSRVETINYATVVFIALAVLMALIFGLDLAFSQAANALFR